MSVAELNAQYGYAGEHPDWPSALWMEAIRQKLTFLGYWYWVLSNLTGA